MPEQWCWWCDQPATQQRTVIPAVVDTKTDTITKAAVEHGVCDKHARMIDREVRTREVEHAITLARGRIRRNTAKFPSPDTEKRRRVAEADLRQLQGELDDLRSEYEQTRAAA